MDTRRNPARLARAHQRSEPRARRARWTRQPADIKRHNVQCRISDAQFARIEREAARRAMRPNELMRNAITNFIASLEPTPTEIETTAAGAA